MQSAPAAAAPVSQRNCAGCGSFLEGSLAPHLCASCGLPQPLTSEDDYFKALGVEQRFSQDRTVLQKKFYELSRALHPDRFTAAAPEVKRRSMERMSFLNQAYNTLKDQGRLREYLLSRAGIATESKSQPHLELAESWFELQDVIHEDPSSALTRVEEFELDVLRQLQAEEEVISQLEKTYDREPSFEPLTRIAKHLQACNYLRSLQRDVGKLKTGLANAD